MDNNLYENERQMSLPSYKKWKIKILTRDFAVKLSPEQIDHINNLSSEMAIDRYVRTILDNALK